MLKKLKTRILKDWYILLLELLLLVVSVATLINVVTVYWRVDIYPVSSFMAVWYTISAFMEQSYYLLINSLVICALLLGTVFAIYKRTILLPLMTLVYLIYDFYVLITWFIDGLETGAWSLFVPLMCISFALIVLMVVYCYICWRRKHPRKKTYY